MNKYEYYLQWTYSTNKNMNIILYIFFHEYESRNQAGVFATGEIRHNIKFTDFWCVFLTKIKVDPESW